MGLSSEGRASSHVLDTVTLGRGIRFRVGPHAPVNVVFGGNAATVHLPVPGSWFSPQSRGSDDTR